MASLTVQGRYNSASPAPQSGQTVDLQLDSVGNLKVKGGSLDGNGNQLVSTQATYSRKTADGQVKASAGYVHSISVAPITATPTAGLLTIYDSLTETGTVLYSEWVFATDVGHTIVLDVAFATGLFVGYDATLANVQTTVSYQ